MKRRLSVKSRVLTGALLTLSLSVGTAGVAVGDTTVSSPVVEDGVYVITSSMDDNKALDVNAESKKDGANVQLWDRNDGNAQRFIVTNLGGNQYSIINEYSGKALDIDGGSKKAGANVHQWTWSGSNNQRFTIEPAKNGGYTIKAVSSSLFLDVKGSRTANGTNVIQWTGNDGKANQRWNLNLYGASEGIPEGWTEEEIDQLADDLEVLFTRYVPMDANGQFSVNVENLRADGKASEYENVQNLADVMNGKVNPEDRSAGSFAQCVVSWGLGGSVVTNGPKVIAAIKNGIRAWNWGLTAKTVARLVGPRLASALGGPWGIASALAIAAFSCKGHLK